MIYFLTVLYVIMYPSFCRAYNTFFERDFPGYSNKKSFKHILFYLVFFLILPIVFFYCFVFDYTKGNIFRHIINVFKDFDFFKKETYKSFKNWIPYKKKLIEISINDKQYYYEPFHSIFYTNSDKFECSEMFKIILATNDLLDSLHIYKELCSKLSIPYDMDKFLKNIK